jgi:hypothetical protein
MVSMTSRCWAPSWRSRSIRRSSLASSSTAADRLPRSRSTSCRSAALGLTHSSPSTTARCMSMSPRETEAATGTSARPTNMATTTAVSQATGT